MHRAIILLAALSFAFSVCACGVDKKSRKNTIGKAPKMAGDWTVVFVPIKGACPLLNAGLAKSSPVEIPGVKQKGNNLSGSFTADGTNYELSGDIILGFMTVVIESPAESFIETLGAKAKKPIFTGSFNGQNLSLDCTESGIFVAAIGTAETPEVTGEWTLTLEGEAADCEDPADEGPFLNVINGVIATSPQAGTVSATYMDPPGELNTLAAAVLGDTFFGGITEVALTPSRLAYLDGTIDTVTQAITGDLAGQLAFPGGVCAVEGDFRIDY